MASFVAQPVTDALESQALPERLFLHDGALVTQTHFRAEQLYHRGQLARLAVHLHGAGTIAGLDVSYAPAAGGPDVEVQVAAGLALDRLGRLIELPYKSCLPLALWLDQRNETPEGQAAVTAGLRAAGGGLPDHLIADVYLRYHACARNPEPAFATGNADTIDGVQPSRILDSGLLDLVIRPDGDDRVPTSLAASQLPDPANADNIRDFKRLQGWDLTRSEEAPFSLPAGGALSEHIIAGNLQDGSEILLARLTVPLDTSGAVPVFDGTIDLSQTEFVPNQDIRPYSYSAAELALLAANLRR